MLEEKMSRRLGRWILEFGRGLVMTLCIVGGASAQERACPDGGRAYFGYCPTDRPAPNLLQQQLEQWAFYPREIALKAPPSILEGMYTNKDPQALYEILAPYDRATVLATPQIGQILQLYKDAYYQFRQDEAALEAVLFERSGTLVSARMSDGWRESVKYYFLRASGHSAEELKKGPQITFYIGIDEAEKAYAQLAEDKEVASKFLALNLSRSSLVNTEGQLATLIRQATVATKH